MQSKNALLIAICLGLGLFLLNVPLALACDPEGDNWANGSKDPRCRLVLPANRAQQSPRAPGSEAVVIASAGNPVLNGSVVNTGSPDYSLSPSCYLPDSSGATNALGIDETCPPPFLPPRVVKAAAPVSVPGAASMTTPVPTPGAASVTTPTTSTVSTKTQPKGDSPNTARATTGEWETIAPGQQVWYRINNENNFYLDIWMDTYGKAGVTFAVYSPEQLNNLSAATVPKGRSAAVKTDTTHDWWWKGAQATGIWHVLVTNYNQVPAQYRIGYAQATEDRNCFIRWEQLPNSNGKVIPYLICREPPPQ